MRNIRGRNSTAAAELASLVDSDGLTLKVVVLDVSDDPSVENTVDNGERIERAVGAGRFVAGVTYVNAPIERPSIILVRAVDMTSFGEMNGAVTPRNERLIDSFQQAGLKVESRNNMQRFLRENFVAICGVGGAEILARQPRGPVLATHESKT